MYTPSEAQSYKQRCVPCGREIVVRKSVSIIIKHRTKYDIQLLLSELQRYVSYIVQREIPDICRQIRTTLTSHQCWKE